MAYEPLHHKYRPQTFQDLVGQTAIATTLSNAIVQQRIAPAYLFSGPRGTGKTSSARILAKSLNCQSGDNPTPQPCGTCEACHSITTGIALDVIEIDAASNTGVDNIRELIEKAQFAPVQCRYKVYVIDECLTGDTLVQTKEGLMRIDDPSIQGKQVLSYNEISEEWEYKPVVRWLDQGDRQTYTIKTNRRRIQCTGNHLIRTEQGWVAAKDVKEKTKILSPVNVVVDSLSTSTEQTAEFAGLPEATNSRVISTGSEPTTSKLSCEMPKLSAHSALAAAARSWKSPHFSKLRDEAWAASNPIGNDIPTKRDMVSGKSGPKTSLPNQATCLQNFRALSTAPCWGMDRLPTPMPIAASPDWLGLTVKSSGNGWNTKPQDWPVSSQKSGSATIRATAIAQPAATAPATPNSVVSIPQSNPTGKSRSQQLGSATSPVKVEHGGTWMTALSPSTPLEHHPFSSTRKDFQNLRINSLLNGCVDWDTWQRSSPTSEPIQQTGSSTLSSGQKPPESGLRSIESTPVPQWHTSFEVVESIECSTVEAVYDIEVEDNHNFVANGLLVHNCHMLSTAAFNALLKTLEEPPERVVFVLATTDPQRVLPTIISRCQRFDYRRIPLEEMVGHLRHIANQELIDIADDALRLVAQLSQGGLRDAESLLDQLSLLPPPVAIEAVWDLVGAVPERELFAITQAIATNNAEAVIERARQLMDRGREPLVVLQNLASFYRDLLVARTAPQRNDLVAITPSTWQEITQFVQQLDVAVILQGQQHLRSSEVQLKNSTQPRLWLEVTLMGLLPAALVQPEGKAIAVAAPTAPAPRVMAPVTTQPPAQPTPQPTNQPTPAASSPPVQVSPPPAPPAAVQAAVSQPSQPDPSVSAPVTPPATSPSATSPPATTHQPPAAAPTPQPTTQPPIEAVVEANAPTGIDLGEMWQQVIANVEYRSTQMLLRQQSQLMRFTGTVAHIAVTQQWLSSIQTRQAAIESALAKVVGAPVKVKLDPVAQKPDAPPSAGSASSGGNPPPATPSPAAVTAQPAAPKAPTPTLASAVAPPVATPTPAASTQPDPPTSSSTVSTNAPPAAPPAAQVAPPVATATGTDHGGEAIAQASPTAPATSVKPTQTPHHPEPLPSPEQSNPTHDSEPVPRDPGPIEDEVEISIDPMAGLSPLPTLAPRTAVAETSSETEETESQAQLAPIGEAALPSAAKPLWEEDEIVRSAQQLAQFFNGEVVQEQANVNGLSAPASEGESASHAQDTSAGISPSPSSSSDDEDVPF